MLPVRDNDSVEHAKYACSLNQRCVRLELENSRCDTSFELPHLVFHYLPYFEDHSKPYYLVVKIVANRRCGHIKTTDIFPFKISKQ